MLKIVSFLPLRPDESLLYAATFSPFWVAVSVLLAILGAYAALSASLRAEATRGRFSRWAWIVVSSVTLGVGSWAMHFIGMLALSLPCGTHYDPIITLISMIPAILASGVAFGVVWQHGERHLPPLLAGLLVGTGIGTMHYAGMAAMHLDGFIGYNPTLFALSIVVAIALAYTALRVKNEMKKTGSKGHLGVAVILGSAVSAMHYTAMSATYFVRGNIDAETQMFSSDMLAVFVAVTTAILALASLALATISRSREMAEQLHEAHQQMYLLLNSIAEGAYGVDVNGNCTFVNQSLLRILGYATADEVIGKHIHELIHHSHPDGSRYPSTECKMYKAYRCNEAVHVVDEVFWSKEGKAIPVEYWSQPIIADGVMQGAIATFIDITQRKLADARIHELAFYDALTLLPNRRLLNDRLDQALAVCKRSGRYGALMFLDLDNFKPLNDQFGHKVGDLLLIQVGHRISNCVRSVDTVARFGGDEFVVLLNELDVDASAASAQTGAVAEKIRTELSEPYLLMPTGGHVKGSVEHHCTASIGVVVFDWHVNPEDLLKCADVAMYESKNAGRNLVVLKQYGMSGPVAVQHASAIVRLAWHQSYCCGELVVDQAHRKLFVLANVLIEAAFSRDEDQPRFDTAFETLLSHVVQHFAEEEAILARHRYSDLETHAHAHKNLIEQVLRLRDKASQGSIGIGELVNFFATDLIAQHMLKADRMFFPLFKASASSEVQAEV